MIWKVGGEIRQNSPSIETPEPWSNHLKMLEQRQYLLNYFKALSVGLVRDQIKPEPPAWKTGALAT